MRAGANRQFLFVAGVCCGRKIAKFAPENKIFLETDTIEESIYEVYNKASVIKGISIEEMKAIVFKNYSTIFK